MAAKALLTIELAVDESILQFLERLSGSEDKVHIIKFMSSA